MHTSSSNERDAYYKHVQTFVFHPFDFRCSITDYVELKIQEPIPRGTKSFTVHTVMSEYKVVQVLLNHYSL